MYYAQKHSSDGVKYVIAQLIKQNKLLNFSAKFNIDILSKKDENYASNKVFFQLFVHLYFILNSNRFPFIYINNNLWTTTSY